MDRQRSMSRGRAEGKAAGDAGTSSNIRVMVRIRPLLPRELLEPECVETDRRRKVTVTNGKSSLDSAFDRVFDRDATQEDVYSELQDGIEGVMRGFNTTIFAYGQTGTGKTYTMFGGKYSAADQAEAEADEADEGDAEENGDDEDAPATGRGSHRRRPAPAAGFSSGIIPRAVHEIFAAAKRNTEAGVRTVVTCSFMQIYNERIQDLLQPYKQRYTSRDPRDMIKAKANLDIREDADKGTYVQDLTLLKVASVNAVMSLIRKGNRHRAVRQTEMNERSSRSHTILQLSVEQRAPPGGAGGDSGSGLLKRSKLNLVDLAGSERWNTETDMGGAQITELTAINTSLLALASVVAALSARNAPSHVRYRDSKLTHLLQDSLGGNCRTAIIATVSPSAEAFEETCSTLKFADRARAITTMATANAVADDSMQVENLQKEISRLRKLLAIYAQGGNGAGGGGGGGGGDFPAVSVELGKRMQALEDENSVLREQLDVSQRSLAEERARVKKLLEQQIAASAAAEAAERSARAARALQYPPESSGGGLAPDGSFVMRDRAKGGAYGGGLGPSPRLQAWAEQAGGGGGGEPNGFAGPGSGAPAGAWGRSSVMGAGYGLAPASSGGLSTPGSSIAASTTGGGGGWGRSSLFGTGGGGGAGGYGGVPQDGGYGGAQNYLNMDSMRQGNGGVGRSALLRPEGTVGSLNGNGADGGSVAAMAEQLAQQASPARWGRSSIFSLASLDTGSDAGSTGAARFGGSWQDSQTRAMMPTYGSQQPPGPSQQYGGGPRGGGGGYAVGGGYGGPGGGYGNGYGNGYGGLQGAAGYPGLGAAGGGSGWGRSSLSGGAGAPPNAGSYGGSGYASGGGGGYGNGYSSGGERSGYGGGYASGGGGYERGSSSSQPYGEYLAPTSHRSPRKATSGGGPPPGSIGKAPDALGTWLYIMGPSASSAKARTLARYTDNQEWLDPHANMPNGDPARHRR